MIKLSILICSIPERALRLAVLLTKLSSQIVDRPVSISVNIDSKIKTIGQKRNDLLETAKGEYVAFVDDDDDVSDDYIQKILHAIQSGPDCCGIEGIVILGGGDRKFIHSLRYSKWAEDKECFYRCPNHISPVLRVLAQQVRFPEKNNGEDYDYSLRLRPLLTSEVYIDGPIYFYRP